MEDAIHIRRLISFDMEGVVTLIREAYTPLLKNPFAIEEYVGAIRKDLVSKEWYFLVALFNEKIVGCAAVMDSSVRHWPLTDVFWFTAHPEFSGKGIGKTLMNEIIARARRDKKLAIDLCTEIPKYFEQFGFERGRSYDGEKMWRMSLPLE